MRKKRMIWMGGALALLVAGAFGADWLLARTAATLLARVQAGLPADTTLTHGALSTNLFRMEAALDTISFTSPQGSFKAQRAVLRGFPRISRDAVGLGGIELLDGHISGVAGFEASVRQLVVEKPLLRQGEGATSPTLTFARLSGAAFATRKEENGSFLNVETFALEDLRPDRLARLQVSGVEGAVPDAHGVPVLLKLDSFSLDSFDTGLLRETAPSSAFLRLLLRDSLRGGKVAGLSVAQEGRAGLALRELAFDGQSVAGESRTALAVSLAGATLGKDILPPPLLAQLSAAGRESLEVDAQFGSRLTPETRTLTFAPVRVVLPGLVEVTLEGVLGGIGDAASLGNGLAFAAATLDRLEVRVRDLGGVAAYVAAQAAQNGVDRRTYAATLATQLLSGAPVLTPVRDGIVTFLQDGGTLTLAAKPASPVSLLQLFLSSGKPEVLAEKLGLSAQIQPEGGTPPP